MPSLQIPTRSNHSRNSAASLEKSLQREIWRKLVVKVILWKDGGANTVSKISSKEWKTYCERTIKTNVTAGRDKVMADLKETWDIIKSHRGFE